MPGSDRNLHQVLTAAQMQAAEQALMDAGTSVHELMERAGKGAAEWIWRASGGRPVTVLCGPGNNGGDGYVIARHIAERGGAVCVLAPIPPKTAAAQQAARKFEGQVIAGDIGGLCSDIFVDCLFGSGLSRPLSSEHTALVARLQANHVLSIAVDVPSGVDTDTGTWPDGIAPYDMTIALGAWKRAHWTGKARALSGDAKLVDIGVAEQGFDERVWPRPALHVPQWDAHKYKRGLVAVIAGEMPGASVLSAHAALGGGAGYVKLLVPADPPAVPADLVVDSNALPQALDDRRITAVLVGPGLGRGDAAASTLIAALDSGKPSVVDADALHLLSPDLLDSRDGSCLVITPHEGELAALCRAFDIPGESKHERALALSGETGMTVLAKGPDTLLAQQGSVAYFPAGPSWLSVAGSGDVLAGIVASRLAVHVDPARAGAEGVYIHHEAARLAGPAFSASKLAQAVPNAYAAFL